MVYGSDSIQVSRKVIFKDVKLRKAREKQERMTKSVQLHCISGTAFLQTELRVYYFEIDFPTKPDYSNQSQVLHEKSLPMGLRMKHSLICENSVT